MGAQGWWLSLHLERVTHLLPCPVSPPLSRRNASASLSAQPDLPGGEGGFAFRVQHGSIPLHPVWAPCPGRMARQRSSCPPSLGQTSDIELVRFVVLLGRKEGELGRGGGLSFSLLDQVNTVRGGDDGEGQSRAGQRGPVYGGSLGEEGHGEGKAQPGLTDP